MKNKKIILLFALCLILTACNPVESIINFIVREDPAVIEETEENLEEETTENDSQTSQTSENSDQYIPVRLWMNGDFVETETPIVIDNDRAMVPVRVISENLGFNVTWTEEEQKVVIFEPGQENTGNGLMLTIGSTEAYVGTEESIQMEIAPRIIADRTYVPLRFVAEAFNINVDWDGENRVAIIGDGYEK